MAVLRQLSVPTLWLLAAEDRDSPTQLTHERLTTLQREGRPIRIATFPNTDHGLGEYAQNPDGSRTTTRFTDGFFRIMGDWALGRLSPPYGAAQFQPPVRGPGAGRREDRRPVDGARP